MTLWYLLDNPHNIITDQQNWELYTFTGLFVLLALPFVLALLALVGRSLFFLFVALLVARRRPKTQPPVLPI